MALREGGANTAPSSQASPPLDGSTSKPAPSPASSRRPAGLQSTCRVAVSSAASRGARATRPAGSRARRFPWNPAPCRLGLAASSRRPGAWPAPPCIPAGRLRPPTRRLAGSASPAISTSRALRLHRLAPAARPRHLCRPPRRVPAPLRLRRLRPECSAASAAAAACSSAHAGYGPVLARLPAGFGRPPPTAPPRLGYCRPAPRHARRPSRPSLSGFPPGCKERKRKGEWVSAGERKRKEAGVLDPAKEKSEGRLGKKKGRCVRLLKAGWEKRKEWPDAQPAARKVRPGP